MNETFRRLDEDPATEGNMIPVPDDLHGEECAAFIMDIWMLLSPMIRPLPRYQKQAAVLRLMLIQLLPISDRQASIPGAELSTMRTAETLRERRIAEQSIESHGLPPFMRANRPRSNWMSGMFGGQVRCRAEYRKRPCRLSITH